MNTKKDKNKNCINNYVISNLDDWCSQDNTTSNF